MTMQLGGSSTPNRHKDFTTPTHNQIAALERYAEDTSIPETVRFGIKHYLNTNSMTFAIASDTIGLIKSFLTTKMDIGNKVTEVGLYVNPHNGAFHLVKISQINRLYALDLRINDAGEKNPDGTWKIRPRFEWVYLNGHATVKKLRADWKATPEQVKKWGDIWSTCIKCHAELTRQDSIDRGMGPTCWKNQFA